MKIDRAIFHPDYKREPFWWEAARPGTEFSADPPSRTEILIIGSGYAGLSAALELKRRGRDVVVVDAMALGEGASSRNGGLCSPGINLGKGVAGGASKGLDSNQMVHALLGESLASYEFTCRVIEREGIDCHLEKTGRFIGAYSAGHFNGLVEKAEMLNRTMGLGATAIPKADQHSEFGSDFYHGGLAIETAAKLHPALYHRGLLELCHRAGVPLSAYTKVEAIEGSIGDFTATTSKGPIRAEQVMVATNGYTGPLTPSLQRRVVPLSSQIIVTEELPEDLAGGLLPRDRTVTETARITTYYRLLPGGRRVMFGGRARFNPVPPDVSAALLYQMMTDRWPQLKGVRLTHSWSGFIAMTTDAMPHMGQLDGLHFCTGCNGGGVAMMSYLGHQVARKILNDGRAESGYDDLDFQTVPVPFYSGNPWFLPIVGGYYRFLDGRERRSG